MSLALPSARPIRPALPGPAVSVLWFLAHEVRLALRDWIQPRHAARALVGAAVMLFLLHLVGGWIAGALPDPGGPDPKLRAVAAIQIGFALTAVFGMLVAQALEGVTRAVYVRGDLDLILSSPAPIGKLFAVRMAATAFTTLWLAGFLLIPIADMLAATRGWRFLGAHGVLMSLSILASAVAIIATWGLFRLFGPARTRLLAQVLGAAIGGITVIGSQVPFILHFGAASMAAKLDDPWVASWLPAPTSPVWRLPAAVHGDLAALGLLAGVSLLAFAAAVAFVARSFASMTIAAAGAARPRTRRSRAFHMRPAASPAAALRIKELRLIARDPWLLSQSLMQVLYLVPPALLLWQNFSASTGSIAILLPVLVMAAAQLGGGLAWVALSAEDAPDLVASAPIAPSRALRAKIEAVLIAVGLVTAPFLVAISLKSPYLALVALVFITLGVAGNCVIQTLFRKPARRSQFRRRQRASRLATFSETALSIVWAAAAGLAAVESPLAAIPAGIALLGLGLGLAALRTRTG